MLSTDTQRSGYCCFGRCSIRVGTVATSVALIFLCAALIGYGWWWSQAHRSSLVFSSFYIFCTLLLLTILFASLAIWGLEEQKFWPCVLVIITIVTEIMGCLIVAVAFGIVAGSSCQDSIVFAARLHELKPSEEGSCEYLKAAALKYLFVCLGLLVLFVGFVYVYAKAIGYIRSLQQANSPPSAVPYAGTANIAYIFEDPPPKYEDATAPNLYM